MQSVGTWWLWVGFFVFVLMVLSVDMFLLGGKKSHRVSVKEALSWTLVWVSCAFIFNLVLWWYLSQTAGAVVAKQKALEFFTGYLIEESLSIDNMFVFILIFGFFHVQAEHQRRVLLYGVLSAIVMRFIVILLGTWLVLKAHWILYVFGVLLIFSGFKMLLLKEKKIHLRIFQ